MAKTLEGAVLFCSYEKEDTFNYTDPSNGQTRLLRSLIVRLSHGDGTVSRERLSLPQGFQVPELSPETVYGFPVTISVSKKRGSVTYTLRTDLKPFPAPPM